MSAYVAVSNVTDRPLCPCIVHVTQCRHHVLSRAYLVSIISRRAQLYQSCGVMIGQWRAVFHTTTVPGAHLSLQHRYRKGRSALQIEAVSMVHKDAGFFVNSRNQKLRTVEYLPDQQTRPKAIVFFHHGYGEHISRYEKGKSRSLAALLPLNSSASAILVLMLRLSRGSAMQQYVLT